MVLRDKKLQVRRLGAEYASGDSESACAFIGFNGR
jgi:hypothetical protein